MAQSSAPNARAYNLTPSRQRTTRLAIIPSMIQAIAIEYTLWVSSTTVGGGNRCCCDEAIATKYKSMTAKYEGRPLKSYLWHDGTVGLNLRGVFGGPGCARSTLRINMARSGMSHAQHSSVVD